jgi:hypothetical protein
MIRPAGEVSRRGYHDSKELSRGVIHRMKIHLGRRVAPGESIPKVLGVSKKLYLAVFGKPNTFGL